MTKLMETRPIWTRKTRVSLTCMVRTLRYKNITLGAVVVGILGYLLMVLRWRNGVGAWESLYYIGGGFGYGMSLNAQFIGLTAAAPEDQQGTAIGVYYLSQQVGMIFGVGSFAALLETVFSDNLRRALASFPERDEVSHVRSSNPLAVSRSFSMRFTISNHSTEVYLLDC